MKWIGVVVAFVAMAPIVVAQGGRGTLAGTVTLTAEPVAGATVQAKELSTGRVSTATTAKNGQFRIADLPAGNYEVSVPQIGLRTQRYVQADVAVQPGQTRMLDIALPPYNQGVLGDDYGLFSLYSKNANLNGLAPRTPDGRPDFSGVWIANVDPNPEPASMLPWAIEEWNRRRDSNFAGMPTARCLPFDPSMIHPVLYKVIQTRSLLLHLFEQEPHYRQTFLDGGDHPKDLDPTWMGHSIGRWEKDTLVIDTVGLNDKSWLLAGTWLPHTEMLHIVSRYRRPDFGHLKIDVTLEDPATFTKPVERHVTWQLARDEDLLESICSENNKFLDDAAPK
jgi:carboxypeptidase family protein